MRLRSNAFASGPHLAESLATAAITTAFAMAGLAASLDMLVGYNHNPKWPDFVPFPAGPLVGAAVARVVLCQGRSLRTFLVAVAALVGLSVGVATRPCGFWALPSRCSLWVAAVTFGAALLASFVVPGRRMSAKAAAVSGLKIFILLPALVVVVLVVIRMVILR